MNIHVHPGDTIEVKPELPFTSLFIRGGNLPTKLNISLLGVSHEIHNNNHSFNINGFESQLIVHKGTTRQISISSFSDFSGELILLNVPELDIDNPLYTYQNDSCEKPIGIDQDVWRNGLNPPTVNPSANLVNHCIIHHSAGSNSATDYTEVVRNIYVQHTMINGWDDIGYNYLIAPDGTLYYGRDGQGIIEDDNVRGAHFCGKNSGTMGICLLGNFQFAAPQTAALNTLEELILWKVNKEGLNPLDSNIHPIPGGGYLNTISGHMDGCATDCPGTLLYGYIENLRDSVNARIGDCPPISALSPESRDMLSISSTSGKRISIYAEQAGHARIFNLQGKLIFSSTIDKGQNWFSMESYDIGIYFLSFRNDSFSGKKRFAIH